jgi:hypothetical protein
MLHQVSNFAYWFLGWAISSINVCPHKSCVNTLQFDCFAL